MQSNPQPKIQQWLEQWQYQSGQLELLISGFSIALLLQMYEPIMTFSESVLIYSPKNLIISTMFSLFAFIGIAVWLFMVVNLIILIILRGIWIGTIGLRTLSANIDFNYLNYSASFTQQLKEKVPSYDTYIERLDRICSIIFSFTFLTIFMLVSIALFVLVLMSVQQIILSLTEVLGMESWYKPLKRIWQILWGICGLLYAFDFLSLGFLKKRERLFQFYFPIYKVLGTITLSRIYRPLYYNLISTKSGRIVAYAILPYFILLYSGMGAKASIYNLPYFYTGASTTNAVVNDFYDDKREGDEITPCSISSRMVEADGFLDVFIRYEPKTDDEALAHLCPNFDPDVLTLENSVLEEIAQAKMGCLHKLATITIDDSTYQQVDYNFYEHPKTHSYGLLTMMDVRHLKRGKHALTIHRHMQDWQTDSVYLIRQAVIPFWVK